MSEGNKPKGIAARVEVNPIFGATEITAETIVFEPVDLDIKALNLDEINAEAEKVFKKIQEEMGASEEDWTPFARDLAKRYDERLHLYIEKGGSPGKWDLLAMCLWYDVEEYRSRHPGSTINYACGQLSGVDQWKMNKDLGSAYNRYVTKASWLEWAEEMGWKRFGEVFSDLISLETREDRVEAYKIIDRKWPEKAGLLLKRR